MFYQKHLPNLPLSNYVESIIYIEGNNKGTGLPKTAMSLVFNLEDSFKLYTDKQFTQFIDYKKYWVAGLQTKPTNVESYGTSKMVVIQFKTLGAFIFLNDPLHYYTDNYIPLDAVFNNLACDTWEQLLEAQTIRDRIAITEKFLQHQLSTRKLPGKKLVSTIELLSDCSHNLTINEICRISGISRKHLNNLSKEYTGVSPKMLASLNRLQSSLKTISSAKAGKLSDVAYELEYFDQAHFNNDFKRFTDLKPTEYVKLTEHIPSLKQVPHFIPFQ
ncbi:MAG: helix-turn-helix transcriptional regulator [Bacteroidia bacterium]|nr:helix-turn-helix transcriptional regulator [Bacteroidia bacterium]